MSHLIEKYINRIEFPYFSVSSSDKFQNWTLIECLNYILLLNEICTHYLGANTNASFLILKNCQFYLHYKALLFNVQQYLIADVMSFGKYVALVPIPINHKYPWYI